MFCLAVLLSSLFVFNQMGPIDESALNQLSLVSQMTKNVRVKADQGISYETYIFLNGMVDRPIKIRGASSLYTLLLMAA